MKKTIILFIMIFAPVFLSMCADSTDGSSAITAAFVLNRGSSTVSVYTIDTGSGKLTEVDGSPVTVGTNPYRICIHPGKKFAYVTNYGSDSISAFSLSSDMKLTEITGSPFALTGNPDHVATDPEGKYLYVSRISWGITAYAIDQATGALEETPESPFESGWGIAIDSSGSYLYTTQSGFSVLGFSIDADSGALTNILDDPAPSVNVTMTRISPDDKYLYVLDNMLGTNVYSIDPATGLLTVISGSPFSADALAYDITVHPSGSFVYLAINDTTTTPETNQVRGYAVSTETGALTEISGSPYEPGSQPYGVAVDPSGSFLYTANYGSNDISGFSIDRETGALTAIDGSPFSAGTGPGSIEIVQIPK
ncbi:MAG TPA: beta-propeller fold lactonase family protein [Spirochaetota bacterium]|nr:beta-propeller fold lactonase family protein [Spirochaetota bacterium]HPI87962.1 beta-propeller fold lactonase family protein [Spirochaetota bacterium]HPR46673.1 beta-propeller fold lactonase family protein [Spirochaetota bacterium]